VRQTAQSEHGWPGGSTSQVGAPSCYTPFQTCAIIGYQRIQRDHAPSQASRRRGVRSDGPWTGCWRRLRGWPRGGERAGVALCDAQPLPGVPSSTSGSRGFFSSGRWVGSCSGSLVLAMRPAQP